MTQWTREYNYTSEIEVDSW